MEVSAEKTQDILDILPQSLNIFTSSTFLSEYSFCWSLNEWEPSMKPSLYSFQRVRWSQSLFEFVSYPHYGFVAAFIVVDSLLEETQKKERFNYSEFVEGTFTLEIPVV